MFYFLFFRIFLIFKAVPFLPSVYRSGPPELIAPPVERAGIKGHILGMGSKKLCFLCKLVMMMQGLSRVLTRYFQIIGRNHS